MPFVFLLTEFALMQKANKYINAGWLILSLIFFTLSFDEMGSFHEYIGGTAFLNHSVVPKHQDGKRFMF